MAEFFQIIFMPFRLFTELQVPLFGGTFASLWVSVAILATSIAVIRSISINSGKKGGKQ